jgi:hypothetical protein
MEILIVDPHRLEGLNPIEVSPPDPMLARAVHRALRRLPAQQRQIVKDRFYRGMTISQIADAHGLTEKQAVAALYVAKRRLQALLADFARQRWGAKKSQSCRICTHPKQTLINRLLDEKSNSESWGAFNIRLSKVIGERINPPRLLITHLAHIKNRKKEAGNG